MRYISSFQRIKFAPSARRHRIGNARALYVIDSFEPVVTAATPWADEKWMWVGADDRGLELEIVAVVPEPTTLLVIHVMPYGFRRNR